MFDNHRYRPAWLLVTALAAIVGGCEVKRSLDVERVESSIQAGIEEQLDIDVKRVRCPDEVWERAGESFDCSVKLDDGAKLSVVVEMRGDGKVRWETDGEESEGDEAGNDR